MKLQKHKKMVYYLVIWFHAKWLRVNADPLIKEHKGIATGYMCRHWVLNSSGWTSTNPGIAPQLMRNKRIPQHSNLPQRCWGQTSAGHAQSHTCFFDLYMRRGAAALRPGLWPPWRQTEPLPRRTNSPTTGRRTPLSQWSPGGKAEGIILRHSNTHI